MIKQDTKNLKKRYLLWSYKTTKEALDRIERKFTQVEIDRFILKELRKKDKAGRIKSFINDFEAYVAKKEADGLNLKFANNELKAEYLFLVLKLEAIEKAIIKECGKKALVEIKALYEKEITERILRSTEH